MAQQARYRCDVDAVFDSACRKRVSHGVKFDMFQMQLPQNPRKVMAEVVRVHHTAATIKNDKIFVAGFPTELFCKALPLQLQQLLSGIYNSRSEEVVFTEPNTSCVFDAIGLESISLMRRTVLSTESIPVDS